MDWRDWLIIALILAGAAALTYDAWRRKNNNHDDPDV